MNVVLKLSKLCNLRCTYCYEFDQLDDPARMPLEGLDFLLRQLAARGGPLAFALHGGEPLLLPPAYFRAVVERIEERLRGLPYRIGVQTNLHRIREENLALCLERGIGLGVSLDEIGSQRVDAQSKDSHALTLRRLDALIASGARQRVEMGGITVLHAGNVARAAETFRQFARLGLDYRILPVFSMADPPPRLRPLMLDAEQTVEALLDVWTARLDWNGPRIRVLPLDDYQDAAMRAVWDLPALPAPGADWALIVEPDGSAWPHAEAYQAGFRYGNAFTESLDALFASAAARRLAMQREERGQVCAGCEFQRTCSGLPMREALASERHSDDERRLRCGVAQPLTAFLAERIRGLEKPLPLLYSRPQ